MGLLFYTQPIFDVVRILTVTLLNFILFFLVKGIGYDSHWVPFHRYCSPCSGRFKKKYISKLSMNAQY